MSIQQSSLIEPRANGSRASRVSAVNAQAHCDRSLEGEQAPELATDIESLVAVEPLGEVLQETWPAFELPTDRPRSSKRSGSRRSKRFQLGYELSQSLESLAQRRGAPLPVVLLAIVEALLWRYTREDDIVLGVVSSEPGGAQVLAARCNVGGDRPFAELLENASKAWFEAAESRPVSAPLAVLFACDLAGDSIELGSLPVEFELGIVVRRKAAEFSLELVYDADLFQPARIGRLAGHFATLAFGVAAHPRRRLSNLPLLTAEEQRQQAEWNATGADYPRRACIHELFEAQAERTPEAIALEWETGRLTYREVNERANRIAHYLRTLGIGPEVPVAICLERSPELIVGVLAILKAGGAYVPLDPSYPQERLAFMLEDTAAPVLLTTRRLSGDLSSREIHPVFLDEVDAIVADQPHADLIGAAHPDNAAYIIYTSGSTGQPKGVVVEHRNVVHSTWSRMARYPSGVDSFLLVLSIAFDGSVAAIFWTLSAGGKLMLPPPGAEKDFVGLAHWIEKYRITHSISVPSLYNLLLTQPVSRLKSLRTVIIGGETCPPALVERHLELLDGAELHNEYGPTEGTVWATAYHCATPPAGRSVPIGRAVANVKLHVLDPSLKPLPVGVPGELYLEGEGIARGYHRRNELTAERFVANTLDGHSGRLYRTGDLVRYLDDGNLEFLGRVDSQVKLRGYRVELGEIEAALRRNPAVAAAAVLCRQSETLQEHLVAYVVANADPAPSPRRLRRWLRDSLPDYMIPAHFIALDALPLTPNGKLDERALPRPDRSAAARQQGYAAPRDELERALVTLWEQAFGLQPIGACDDFFDLGGDSLVAAALFARVEHEFGRALALDVLLERPTVRLLAELLREKPAGDVASSAITIQSGDGTAPLFCLPGIGGNVMEFRALAQRLGPRQTVYGLRPAGLDDGRQPHESIADMAACAVAQMRAIQPHGPYALAGFSLGGLVAFEMGHQLRAAGESISLLALLDSRMWSPPVALSTRQKLRLHWQNLYRSSNRGRWHYLRERLRLLWGRICRGNLGHAEDDVIMGLDLSPSSRQVARAHWRAWREYEPRVFDGALTLFVAQHHPDMSAAVDSHDPTLGWARWTTQSVDVHMTNRAHAEVLRASELEILAAQLALSKDTRIGEAA